MSINGISNLNYQAAMKMTKTQFTNQAKMSAAATGKATDTATFNTHASKPAAYDDVAGRIANIPNLEQYEAMIQRFLSGESEMESADKPLTEDQIALRQLMREYQRTDTRSLSQIQGDMQKANNNFREYWQSSGNTGPMPGRLLFPDGSFKIFGSKEEKDEYMKGQKMDFLKNAMSVIKAG